jgi:predicted hydrocarbon binding protein
MKHEEGGMSDRDFEVELLRKWVQSLLATLDDEFDRETQARLLETCGRTCAAHHGDLDKARGLGSSSEDIDRLLEQLNGQFDWCGEWRRDGDAIVSVCERCGCPLVREGLVKLVPAFCECSRGFVGALFERVFGRPVSVVLKRAIGRSDPVCEFVVRR